MLRQRLRTRSSSLASVGTIVLVLVALLLIFYGAMLLALALKVSPETINAISGYGTAYDALAGIEASDVDGAARLIAGIAGLVVLLVFGLLAFKELPRPYLARGSLRLGDEADAERGATEVGARAIERAAEAAALDQPAVSAASGRYGTDELTVGISMRHASEVPGALRDVQRLVRESLERHGLPVLPVNVTLTGFDRSNRQRELK
jgi:hypothetical protein